ncbi:hypothetical protein N8005_07600 [Litorivicinus sp.]|nr:hypothetical protein [Litorivicinus sp.]
MKSHDELKAVQQQMAEAKKNERAQRSEASLQRVWLYCWDAERLNC